MQQPLNSLDNRQDVQLSVIDRVVALHSYEPNKPTKLTLQKDDLVAVITKHDNGWWAGFKIPKNSEQSESQTEPEVGWFPSSFVGPIPVPEIAVVDQPTKPLIAEVVPVSWDSVVKEVITHITALKTASQKKSTSNYLSHTRAIVIATDIIFEINITDSVASPASIIKNREALLKSLMQLVQAAHSAQTSSASQDSDIKVRFCCGNLLLALRKYVESCVHNDIRLSNGGGRSFGLNISQSIASFSSSGQQSDVSPELSDQQVFQKLEDYSIIIKASLNELMVNLEQEGDNLDSEKLQKASDSVIKISSEVASFVDELRLDESFNDLSFEVSELTIDPSSPKFDYNQVRSCREALNLALSNLMSTVAAAMDQFAAANATRNALLSITVAMKCLKDLMISVKLATEYKTQMKAALVNQEAKIQLAQLKQWQLQDDGFQSGNKQANCNKSSLPDVPQSESDDDTSDLDATDVRWRTTSVASSAQSAPAPRKASIMSTRSLKPLTQPKRYDNRKFNKFFGSNITPIPDTQTLVEQEDNAAEEGVSRKMKKFFGDELSQDSLPVTEPEKPQWLGPDYKQGELIFNMDGDRKVKAGSLAALVQNLVSHENPNFMFTIHFLITFRLFTNASKFIELLEQRFNITAPAQLTTAEVVHWHEQKQRLIQYRVFKVLKIWIEDFWVRSEDNLILDQLKAFVDRSIFPILPREAEKLLELMDKRSSDQYEKFFHDRKASLITSSAPSDKNSTPPPIMPKTNGRIRKVDEIDPEELARQLSLIEHKLYVAIQPVDLLYYRPDERKRKGSEFVDQIEQDPKLLRGASVREMIHESNLVTGWVAGLIVIENDVKRRAQLMKHFIKTAEKLHEMKNFATREAILAALNSTPVYRLKKTWEELGPKSKLKFEALCKHMDRENNFMTYRNTLKVTQPPCVPFLGLYLTDMTFLMQGNADTVSRANLINFDKYSRLAAVIEDIQRLQAGYYRFTDVSSIQTWLRTNMQFSRDVQDLHDLSLAIEPREQRVSATPTQSSTSNTLKRVNSAMSSRSGQDGATAAQQKEQLQKKFAELADFKT